MSSTGVYLTAGNDGDISITGDSGGALSGGAFTFTGGTTGLLFAGSGTTETLTLTPSTSSGSSTSPTLNAVVGCITITGLTTATTATQLVSISNNKVKTTSCVLVTASNLNASTNGAAIGIQSIVQAASSLKVTLINNGSGALGTGDNVLISFWVLS